MSTGNGFIKYIFIQLFSYDQAALWMVQSVYPFVCPSVCNTFYIVLPSSYHHEIFRSYYHQQKLCPWKKSRSEVKGQGQRGQNPTLPFPDHNSSLNSRIAIGRWPRGGTLLFLKVILLQGHTGQKKIANCDPNWAFLDCNSSLNSLMAMKWCSKLKVA